MRPTPSTRKRLWLAGGALGVFLLTLMVGNFVVPRDRAVTSDMVGHDFLAFYTAGTFVRTGRANELYDLDSVKRFEQSTGRAAGLTIGDSFGPWWNPPVYALVFAPLSALPYRSALAAWRYAGLAACGGAVWLLVRWLPRSWAWRGLVPLLLVTSMPFLQTFTHGQNTFTSLLILAGAVTLWRDGSGVRAGMAAGLLFYKPQLAAVVAAVMTFDLGRRAAVGLGVTGLALLAVTAVALPGSTADWLHRLPANVRFMQVDHDYLWERHVTLKAFWRLLLQGRTAGEPRALTTAVTDLSIIILIGAGVWAAWKGRSRSVETPDQSRAVPGPGRPFSVATELERLRITTAPGRERPGFDGRLKRDRLITATIVAMPLLMPFYFDYDLLLLAVPATLYAIDPARDRRLTACWAALFLWAFVNPAVGLHARVDGTVVILSAIAATTIARVGRRARPGSARLQSTDPARLAA